MKSKYKNQVSLFFGLVVTIATSAALVALIIISGICNVDILKKSVNESSYYDNIVTTATDNLKSRLRDSDLPENIADDIIADSNLTIAIEKVINKRLEGDNSYRFDASRFENTLDECIAEYCKDNGVVDNDEISKSRQLFVQQASVEYSSIVDFKFAEYFRVYSNKYEKICKTVIYISIAVIILSLIMLVIIHRRKYRGIRYINYGLISGTVLAIILNVLIKNKMVSSIVKNGAVKSDYISMFIAESFSQGIYVCFLGMMLSVVMIGITVYLRKEAI